MGQSYRETGYLRNPFGALTTAEWAALAILPPSVERFIRSGSPSHLQVIARKGRGKTSTLLALAHHFTESRARVAYERLPPGHHQIATDLPGLDVFCLDEAQRLAPNGIARLIVHLRKAGGPRLMIGSHIGWGPLFALGRLPLYTARLGHAQPAHLVAIVERRLAHFALSGEPCAELAPGVLAHLVSKYGSNIRAIEAELYEAFQKVEGPALIGIGDLPSHS